MENRLDVSLNINHEQISDPQNLRLNLQVYINGHRFELPNLTLTPAREDPLPTPEADNFWPAFEAFLDERGQTNSWTSSTYGKLESFRSILASFCPKDIHFSYFDTAGLNAYIHFLSATKNMRNSTIVNHLSLLKWFLRWSLSKGYHHNRDFEWFKPKLRKTKRKVVFLTWEELNRLKQCEIPKNKHYLERVRDVFLFCCFTGLRYSDVYNLKRSDVKDKRIEITTIKTAVNLNIELNDHSRAILNKYKHADLGNDKALPVISNQKMNLYIKELGQIARINEPVRLTYYRGNRRFDEICPKYEALGTHTGRRTFICNALSLGIPPQIIMKWTGHSDYAAMRPYIDISDEVKSKAMRRFNFQQTL